jgi:hypothetical protein
MSDSRRLKTLFDQLERNGVLTENEALNFSRQEPNLYNFFRPGSNVAKKITAVIYECL